MFYCYILQHKPVNLINTSKGHLTRSKKKKQSSDQESGRNSSLHVKPFLLSYTFTHAFCPPTRFPRPLLSALCGLVMFLPAVICTVLDRHTGLLFKCLAANAFRVPGGRQNSCRILCFIIFPSSEGRGYHWNKGVGGISPSDCLDTDFRMHQFPWNITLHDPPGPSSLEGHHNIVFGFPSLPGYLSR